MEHINYGKNRIEYSVRRGERKKTLAINITPTAQVIVLAPRFLSIENIRRIVKKRANWILKKTEFFKNLGTLYPEKELVSGEQLLFLGRKYRLKIKETQKGCSKTPKLIGRRIFISIDKSLSKEKRKKAIRDILVNWYFSKAQNVVEQRARRYRKLMGLNYAGIDIKNQKRRWGSCSNGGILRFNWKIAMAPISIVDYIVVHELCHLKVKNHSADFWRQVSLVLPDYQTSRDWLKDNAGIFNL